MIGAELMRDAALLGAECHVAVPADHVPAADEGWAAQPQARAALLRAHARARAARRPRPRAALRGARPRRERVLARHALRGRRAVPRGGGGRQPAGRGRARAAPDPDGRRATAARHPRGPVRRGAGRRRSTAAPPGEWGSSRCSSPLPGLPHSQHALRLVHAELAAAHDDPASLGAHRELADRDGAAGRRDRRSTPSASATPPGCSSAGGLLVVRGPSRRGGRQLACDIARAPRPGRRTSSRSRRSCRGSPSCRGMRDGLLVLDLHALSTVPQAPLARLGGRARAARRARRRGGGHRRARRGRRRRRRLPGGAAHLGAAARRGATRTTMAARFRVSVEEARGAIREARDLRQAAPTPTRRPAARARRRRRADPGAGRAPHGPPRQRRRDVRAAVRSRRARRPARSSSRRSSPGSAAATACAGAWTSASATRSGTGLTCLMAGKSGTGKTFAARCLANELGLNLYRIDLSQVVSKYIGETEKALAQVFDEVEAGHGLLLFDEADALFGRRSEVKDAHDRYANIEVGYLLQRLESYDGIAVLTTNLQGNMDAAFVRRLRFILHFPAPDRELRRRLWERSLPGAGVARRRPRARRARRPLPAQRRRDPQHRPGRRAPRRRDRVGADHVRARRSAPPSASCRRPGRPSDAAAFGPLAELATRNGGAPVSRRARAPADRPRRRRADRRSCAPARSRRRCARRSRCSPRGWRGRRSAAAARRRCGRWSSSSSGRSRPTGWPGPGAAARLADELYERIVAGGRVNARAQLPARRVHRLRARRLSGQASA